MLIPGGAGLIGSEIVKQLFETGAAVRVLDNFSSGKKFYLPNSPKVEVIAGDISDKSTVKKAVKDCEIIINSAGLPFVPYSIENPEDVFRVNVMGSLNLLWEAANSGTVERFVQLSSDEVYGDPKYFPIDERHPLSPHSSYAVSELSASRLTLLMHKEHGLPSVVLRPFNTYGPNVTQPYIIPEIIVQLLRGEGKVFLGNVESVRDFTYVSDTARAIVLASVKEGLEEEVFNIGSGTATKIRDLVFLIASIMNIKAELALDKTRLRPFDISKQICDFSKARRLLSWSPRITLEKGLPIVVDWLRNHPNVVKNWVPYIENILQKPFQNF